LTAQNASNVTTKNYSGSNAKLSLTNSGTVDANNNDSNFNAFSVKALDSYSSSASVSISNITKANPGVVTTSAAHNFVTGDKVYIKSVTGMTQVNSAAYSVAVIDATHFSIGDTSGYSSYGSGGTALKKAATGTDLSTRLINGSVSSGTWSNGVATDIQLGFQFKRLSTGADGPYITAFGIAPVDSDGVQLASYDMDVSLPTGNEHAAIGTLQEMRYGRLLISNTYGTELLALPVNVQAQYWGGSTYVSNPDDSCTSLNAANFTLEAGGGAAITTTITGGGTMASGAGILRLSKPSPAPTGKGSVILKTNPAVTPWPINGYLPGSGIETFGIYKSPLIYLREIYN
jgi:hypothetical protein